MEDASDGASGVVSEGANFESLLFKAGSIQEASSTSQDASCDGDASKSELFGSTSSCGSFTFRSIPPSSSLTSAALADASSSVLTGEMKGASNLSSSGGVFVVCDSTL